MVLLGLVYINPAAKVELQPFADDAHLKTVFARDWRNKRFAHHD